MTDRRTEERFPVSVAVTGWGANLDSFEGHTRDFSGRGIYIIANAALKADDRFAFLMSLPELLADEEATPVWVFCKVVRVEPAGLHANGQLGIAATVEEYVMPTRGLGAEATPLQAAA